MKRTRHQAIGTFIIVFSLLILPVSEVFAQGGGDDDPLDPIVAALLSQIETAYNNTSQQNIYQISIEEERTQNTAVRRFVSGTYLMDVTIFEAFVNIQTDATESSATFGAEDTYLIEVETEFVQEQGIGFEYVRDGVTLSIPENVEDELELAYRLGSDGDQTLINTDPTGCEFRVGVPEGWRALSDDTLVSENTTLSSENIQQVVDGLSLSNITAQAIQLLSSDLVMRIDLLETETVNDELARRYSITFNGPEVLAVLGIDPDALIANLESAATDSLSMSLSDTSIDYVMEILIGTQSGLLYEQNTSLSMQGSFAAGDGSSAVYSFTQVNNLSVSEYGSSLDTTLPEAGSADPDESCVLAD